MGPSEFSADHRAEVNSWHIASLAVVAETGEKRICLSRARAANGTKLPFAAVQKYGRFLGYSGREMLAVSLSGFDPKRSLAI